MGEPVRKAAGPRVLAGSSGFSYKPWRGAFYPEKLPESGMLAWYAARLPVVEINNTFYRMPRPAMLGAWAGQVPDGFRFALKAPQRITHQHRLKDADKAVGAFFAAAAALGDRLGPALFQLPPHLRKDLPLLEAFLAALPPGRRVAFEFRHPSWFEDDVRAALAARGAALCISETEEAASTAPLVATTGWGYLRLRRADYAEADLRRWAERIGSQPWSEAYVFFKHEDKGVAPRLAARLMEIVAA